MDSGYPPDKRSCSSPTRTGGAFLALFVIAVGLALLVDNLGIANFDVWTWIPLLLVAFGVLRMVESEGRPSRLVFGALVALGGALWLLDNLQIIHVRPNIIWPIAMIGWGVALLLKTLERQNLIPRLSPVNSDSVTAQYAVFGGSKFISSSQEYAGGDAFALFGGIELDLRTTAMKAGQATFDAHAMFGGVEIYVPANWNVVLRGSAIFGGWEDKTAHPLDADAPRFIVSGFAIFGGVTILN